MATLHTPESLPRVVEHAALEVEFTGDAVANGVFDEALVEIRDSLDDVSALMAAGFLCRTRQAPASHTFQLVSPHSSVLRVEVESTGAHANLLPLLVRLVYYLHQTPRDAFEMLVSALEGDEGAAREAFAGAEYGETVEKLRLVGVDGRGEPLSMQIRTCEVDSDAVTPQRWPDEPYAEWERLVVGGFDASAELDFDLENAWLCLSMMRTFVPFGQSVGLEPGDEEFFFRQAGVERELVCDALAVETFWLAEWLTCLVGGARGDLASLVISPGTV